MIKSSIEIVEAVQKFHITSPVIWSELNTSFMLLNFLLDYIPTDFLFKWLTLMYFIRNFGKSSSRLTKFDTDDILRSELWFIQPKVEANRNG